ncbi:MAG: P-loop NTPase fold protein [Actinomycetota bacterium]
MAVSLWSDDPADVDLLGFAAVAETVLDAVLSEELDPVAVSVSGRWGSGKTTVLRLVQASLSGETAKDAEILVVSTDPWRYDPGVGPKESLIQEVLSPLRKEVEERAEADSPVRNVLSKLLRRVKWSKALHLAARTSLTLQLPSPDQLLEVLNLEDGKEDQEQDPSLAAFREEFAELMSSRELEHIRRVVVLVDDLDRCLPETVVDTLEAIKLFLSVPKMSFVIAADEHRVAEALVQRFPGATEEQEGNESPARLYLHKIVQTTIPLPGLSRFDTEAYLALLLLHRRLEEETYATAVEKCEELRRAAAGNLEALSEVLSAETVADELALAGRLTPILYERLRGNPRRIKRFLNDLNVRQAIARRRGIELQTDVVAKLMVLEVLLPDEFATVLSWLAKNELRERLQSLEQAASGIPADAKNADAGDKGSTKKAAGKGDPSQKDEAEWGDSMLRWAKLPPALAELDLAPYFHLAAAFGTKIVLDTGIPERLRDLAANLTSGVRAVQKSVSDDELSRLTTPDAVVLAEHLARAVRDRPKEQLALGAGLLRVTRAHSQAAEAASRSLGAIPPSAIEPAFVLQFSGEDVDTFKETLERWEGALDDGPTRRAIQERLKSAGQ